jgi:microcystin-dependent protein
VPTVDQRVICLALRGGQQWIVSASIGDEGADLTHAHSLPEFVFFTSDGTFDKANYPGLRAVRMGHQFILEPALATSETVIVRDLLSGNGRHVGEIELYAGATAPDGFFICDGAAVSRTTYAALFSVVGTIYGVGDGSTSFNLPDLRTRFPVGSQVGGDYDLGDIGGEESVILTAAQMPLHTHTGPAHTHAMGTHVHSGPSHTHTMGTHVHSGPSHTHTMGTHVHDISISSQSGAVGTHGHLGNPGQIARSITTTGGFAAGSMGNTGSTDPGDTNASGTANTGATDPGDTSSAGTGSTGAAGADGSHENRPPFLALNFIINAVTPRVEVFF